MSRTSVRVPGIVICLIFCISSIQVIWNLRTYTKILSGVASENVLQSGGVPVTATGPLPYVLDLGKTCPDIPNALSQNKPPSEVLSKAEVGKVVHYWFQFNCDRYNASMPMPMHKKSSCNFDSLAQHLLYRAMQLDQTLLTVQIGGMDGKSNDPMYQNFVLENEWQNKLPNRDKLDLKHWLPVVIEPVPTNFEALSKTYSYIRSNHRLACAVPIHAAVSYNVSSNDGCKFCRVNTAEDAPQICKDLPDWMKLQLGSLDCDYHRKFHGENFDTCILQDPLPCGGLRDLLSERALLDAPTSILQIDVEGYESIILREFLANSPDHLLPPVIHYEHKVMKQIKVKEYERAITLLESKGYVLCEQGEDFLAMRIRADVR